MRSALRALQDQPSSEPFIVRIIDPPSDVAGLADVLIGAIGLTGVVLLASLVFGVVVAGGLFWLRSRSR
jgi:hypothetical protein